MRNNVTKSGATIAPSTARGITTPAGHGRCSAPCSEASRPSSPPHESTTSVAPAASAPRAISTVSSVSPE